ncbi:hypothetical protein C7974DRAFT_466351 [Boeremia exigua]|uniref:uncharacterized protein n=1 Tax=Boeremia exigua TaxID=749465 RepID=UPI001E8E24D8|nr:uncharacterized protein C7974DRAFT_466351 [Boeremia exigua]KAH6615399.1 hypothetical protein C7974DRAFT_466351 [Boeremia exigua]
MKHASQITAIVLIPIGFLGLTIGLTYAPCYATVCPEDFLHRETKIHLGTFYLMLAIFGFGLFLQSYFASMRTLCSYCTPFEIPILRKRLSVGGFLVSVWIIGSTLATTAIWMQPLLDFWGLRTDPLEWTTTKLQLTFTGVTGHYADFLMGLMIIPVSRNSLVGRAFGVHHSTLMAAHKFVSYLFTAAVVAHGVTYLTYAMAPFAESELKDHTFATGNPTMTLEESEARGSWYTTTTYNGIASLLIIIVIVLTSLPFVRRRNYNMFYYFHCFCSTSIFIGASIHASTDFYLVLPGLFLYMIDIGMRVFSGESGGSHNKVAAIIENAGADWYRISFPAWDKKSKSNTTDLLTEKALTMGFPLKYYYINVPNISKMQNHPFTAAVPSTNTSGPVFLFQKSQGKKQKSLNKEWTWKLGNMVPNSGDKMDLEVRLEGPYLPRDTRFETAYHTLCIVGGTGLTGAYSLATWWLEARASNSGSTFTLVWTIRDKEASTIAEWQLLNEIAARTPGLMLITHVSSQDGRLDPAMHVRKAVGLNERGASFVTEKERATQDAVWVYGAGPDGLVRSVEGACVRARADVRKSDRACGGTEINWYMAKWEV